ncbi:MAG: ComEC/Rec2 family competence protein [Puniceicoccales bacterium]|jgi:competence protein ComEC|nr:ComEC/Rec2 family competence protein [Puniceicoccales bacterium]
MSARNAEESGIVFLPARERVAPGRCVRLPLLWFLVPLVSGYAACFTFEIHAPLVAQVFIVSGGVGAAAVAFLRPGWTWIWGVCQWTGATGLALLVFELNVRPVPGWEGLPPREARLGLRWEQVFASRPDARSVGGVARVVAAPAVVSELVGTDVYCRLPKPVPAGLVGQGVVFDATGVVDTVRRQAGDGAGPGFCDYLERRRVNMAFTRVRDSVLVSGQGPFRAWCSRQRERMREVLEAGLGDAPDCARLYAGMLLGRAAGLPGEQRNAFARTGTAHLFSVSGLHVGVIAAALFYAGRRLPVPNALVRVAVIAVMFVFVMVTGWAAAALRAWLMVAAVLAAKILWREGGPAEGLVLAATGVLLWEPGALLDAGFQLSYGVVGAIVLYGVPLAGRLQAWWRPWRYLPGRARGWRRVVGSGYAWLTGSAGISFAAMLASGPLIVAYFNLFSAGSLVANLVVVPLAFPVIVLGFASMVLGMLGLGALAVPLNGVSGAVLRVLDGLARWLSDVPGVAWELGYREAGWGPAVALVSLGVMLVLPVASDGRRCAWGYFLVPPLVLLLSFLLGGVRV